MAKNDISHVMTAWWERDIAVILQDLEDDIRREERRRYPGGELPPTVREVGVCLAVNDRLRKEGIMEVTQELFHALVDQAMAAGVGKELEESG